MILIIHLLVGAAIASYIKPFPLALLLAFLSHFVLDFIPHWEYSIKNIQERKWSSSFPDFVKLAVDFTLGITIILFFSRNGIILAAAFFAVLNDIFAFLNLIFKNRLLKADYSFHEKLHYLNNTKKIPLYLRILSQIIVGLASILLLIRR